MQDKPCFELIDLNILLEGMPPESSHRLFVLYRPDREYATPVPPLRLFLHARKYGVLSCLPEAMGEQVK